ncbi:MmgE/PrpD family protein [Hyphomicrobiales bacterium]|nr:MmgE/PrpD family protein [Hyphomicrobiales bacterium]CAH1691535.1 MmgE/PrpD family protein [Hyphomicrobiales bacterium]
MSFSHALAERALSLRLDDRPAEIIHIARRAVADTIGVALAGCRAPFIDALEAVTEIGAAPGEATLWGRGKRASVLQAALINGVSAHALDFDDCSTTMGGHPSAPVLPAILALAESRGASAGQVFEAYVTGFEVETRLARGLLPHHYEKGWHPTATLGVFGATAASSRLLGFDAGQMANALSMAVSMASGLKSNFGTPVKPLHVGQAAYNGVLAALMTERGMGANAEAFEHNYGFFRLFNGEGNYDAEAILSGWDGPLDMLEPGIAIKQHPCCGSAHSAIDAALAIVAEHGLLDPASIELVETSTHERRLAHTNRPRPQSGLDAKFSVQFLSAKALTEGRIRLGDFDDATFLTAPVAELLPRVRSSAHQDADAYLGKVRVILRDGRALEGSASTRFGRGPTNPMSDAELKDKFTDCALPVLGPVTSADLFDHILGLAADADMRPVLAACAAKA